MLRRTRSMLARACPDPRELYRLVLMETDPRYAGRFDELTPGPLVAVIMAAAILAYGAVAMPFRILRPR
jgi:hypothetical protein